MTLTLMMICPEIKSYNETNIKENLCFILLHIIYWEFMLQVSFSLYCWALQHLQQHCWIL